MAPHLVTFLIAVSAAVLFSTPNDSSAQPEISVEPPLRPNVVNEGLTFGLDNLTDYVIESTMTLGDEELRRTRVTYRLIDSVDGSPLRVERYLESETLGSVGSNGPRRAIRYERIRSVAHLDGLSPVSSNGEIRRWNGHGWATAEHSLRFESNRVKGIAIDMTGRAIELDHPVPRGVVLSDLRDFAFAIVSAESLPGRSVELSTFDPWNGELAEYRYDVMEEEMMDVAGAPRDVLRVNIAFGLGNETMFFEREHPRLPVRRISSDGMLVESFTRSRAVAEVIEPPTKSTIPYPPRQNSTAPRQPMARAQVSIDRKRYEPRITLRPVARTTSPSREARDQARS